MNFKRLTALLCSASLLLSCLPPAAVQAEDAAPSLPAAFDLREKGLISAVKNQDPYGTCWCFGTMASIESELIARDPQIDLSEWYLVHRSARGASGMWPEKEGRDYLNDGGVMCHVIAMLTNWIGPVREAFCPYDGPDPDFSKTLQEIRAEADFHVTDFHYIQDNNRDPMDEALRNEVKQALYEGHAIHFDVGTSAFSLDNIYNQEHSAYYMPETFWDTFDYEHDDTNDYLGHVMCIVGWDDTIPASWFSQTPSQDGAWLVKNSWGTDWGDDGYFWMSYDNALVGSLIYYDMEDAACHDTLYAYDDYGCNGAYAVSAKGTDTTAYGANVFTAEKDGFLTDVMVNCVNADDDCEITIYTGLSSTSDPTSGTASAATSCKLAHIGYQTVPLTAPVRLTKDEAFSVVVRFTGSKGAHLPCELGYVNTSAGTKGMAFEQNVVDVQLGIYYSYELMKRSFAANQSFFSADGKTWNDMYKQSRLKLKYGDIVHVGNLCIKAVAVDAGKVQFSDYHEALPLGEQITLTTCEDAPICYAVNGGSYQVYTDPIPFTGDMTLSAYVDTGEKRVYTQTYTQQRAALSSLLLRKDKWTSEYLDVSSQALTCEIGSDAAYLVPISTGTITINGKPCTSGEKYSLSEASGGTLTIRVEQENLLPATYEVTVDDVRLRPIPDCVARGSDETLAAYEFLGGNGRRKDLETGEITAFTYERQEDGSYVFRYDDHEETLEVQLTMTDISDITTLTLTLVQEGKDDRYLYYLTDRRLEDYPCFSNPELHDALKAYHTAMTGQEADRTETDSEQGYVNVYAGETLLKRYYLNLDGTIWDKEQQDYIYILAVTGDVNTDQTINASDAAQILIEAAARGGGKDSVLSYAGGKAADVNADGSVNASDAAIVLMYAAAAGAGDKTARLCDFVKE